MNELKIKKKRNRSGDNKRLRISQSRFSRYTSFNVPRELLLMQIRDVDLLQKLKGIKTVSNHKDKSRYCKYHMDYSHNTNDFFDLKEEIESLIQRGYFKDFIRMNEPIDIQNEAPINTSQNVTAVVLECIEDQEIVGRALIKTIFGGPGRGGHSNKARKAHVREV